MTNLIDWLKSPWSNLSEARRHLAESEAEKEEVQQLAKDLRKIYEENHITAKMHAAFRGGRQ
jgi:transposase-like protein